LIEFAATIPPKYKIKILEEKHILKQAYRKLLPASIVNRPKQPYRAPISRCFLEGRPGNVAATMIAPEKIREYGYFSPEGAERLIAKAKKNSEGEISARDDMAMVAMVSTQLLHHHFLRGETTPAPAPVVSDAPR
jgi:asparagine synthase (glutamine-hydrolysing)